MSERTRRRLTRGVGTVAGAAGMIAVITMASRAVGFGRWFAQAATLGDSATANAYASANLLPNVLFEVAAGGALAGTVVPLLAAPLARHLRGDVDRIASALLSWTLLALVPLGILVALLAGPIVSLLPNSAGSDVEVQREVATFFLRIFAVQIPLYGVGVVLSGILQAQRRFLLPALAPLASSVVVIATYLLFGVLGEGLADSPGRLPPLALETLAWGTTAGVAAMSLPLAVPVLRSGIRLRPTLHFPPGVAPRARHLAAAGIGALLAQQVSVVVVLVLARAGGVEGTITIFQYAQAVYYLPYAVLAVPVATAVFPRLAESAAEEDRSDFVRMSARTTRVVVAAASAGVALLVAGAPAATALFSVRGTMEGMTTAITWLAPGVVGYALVFHVSRCLYTVDRGRAAVLATAAGWLTVAVASAVAVRVLAPDGGDGPGTLQGLAIGSSVGMVVAGVALLLALRRVTGALPGLGRTVVVAGAGAVVGAVAGRWVTEAMLGAVAPQLLGAVVAACLGCLVGGGVVLAACALGDRSVLRVRQWT
ncbi:murein biosynthesis integral membrane protein MurJ [Georgenia faecalis]|uniref:murein biosynthesis integral membrane protein MurJ n=1 Tax=Georgenia faecalis TaxID=2483799 RepID=UPI0019D00FC6|nr:lipid II flippase MurJ [Georgenia faecalis]